MATEKTLSTLKLEFKRLKSEEKGISADIDKLTFEEKALVERSIQVAQEKDALAARVKSAEQRVEQEQIKIRGRLRSLYINSSTSSRTVLLPAARSSELERMAVYATSVRRNDEKRFQAVKQAVEKLLEARRTLDASLEEGRSLQGIIQGKRADLEEQRTKLQGVIRKIQDKQQKAKVYLALLSSEATKLEDLLQSMTGGTTMPQQPETEEVAPRIEPEASVNPSPAISQQKDVSGISPNRRFEDVAQPGGLFGKTVRITAPVQGDVLQRFGKTKIADFSDMIFSKGLEFKTAEGSYVRAVLGGRVAFAGVMPGYETVIIIDHGARSYSLYGRLGKSLVKKGDIVDVRDPIGVTSAPDERGRNFYFETRKNGAPVDPSSILARAS